ncbi:YcaO-like family protein [Sorangium sp. So ce117]|uniref:YcaO-like family protein n=1 Tax=Sorangium sp. So ce117 TaxID=3133277 RepID=UPI003F5F1A7F
MNMFAPLRSPGDELARGHVTPRRAQCTPLAEIARRLRTLVSPYTGVVRDTVELLRAPDDCRFFNVGARTGDMSDLVGAPSEVMSSAVHPDREAAWVAAVAEAVERYSSFYVPAGDLVLSSYEELDGAAPEPESFALFHPSQYASSDFPYVPFTSGTRVRWARGWSIQDGMPAWLPAQLTFMGSHLARGEPQIAYATSSGTALGGTLEEAAFSALMEVIERDAFMLAWNNRLELPLLDWQGDDSLRHDERVVPVPAGIHYAALDASVFFRVPTAIGVTRCTLAGQPALTVGAASAATGQEAARKALREAFQTRVLAKELLSALPRGRCALEAHQVRTFDDHAFYHALRENSASSAFLDRSRERRYLGDVPPLEGTDVLGQTASAVRALARRGVGAYLVDITSPDVRDAGLWVVRVICPELCRLDAPHTARFLGGKRLYHAAYEAGLRDRPLSFADINVHPHPFP